VIRHIHTAHIQLAAAKLVAAKRDAENIAEDAPDPHSPTSPLAASANIPTVKMLLHHSDTIAQEIWTPMIRFRLFGSRANTDTVIPT
jgi:hypothetical protein